MYKNYIKTFISQLARNKLLALINILGLSVGLASCLLIALFVNHEIRYDSFFPKSDAIHRLSLEVLLPDGVNIPMGAIGGAVAPFLENTFSEVQTTTRMQQREVELRHDNHVFNEKNFYLIDKNFFSVFEVEWLQGTLADAFTYPGGIVLTESTAKHYFGDTNALGQILLMDEETLLTVNAVVKDLPTNTHLNGKIFASIDLLDRFVDDPVAYMNDWWGSDFYTYVVLADGANPEDLIDALSSQYAELPLLIGLPPGMSFNPGSTPLTDIHLKSPTLDELNSGGSMAIVYTFISIGIGIMLIASINFVNISTAWGLRRTGEVGVKKVLGATPEQLTGQFLLESFLMCMLATVLALVGVSIFLPVINGMLAINLWTAVESLPYAIALLCMTVIGLSIFAGWYPALCLSAHKPSAVFKGAQWSSQPRMTLKNILIVLQFVVVIVLLAVTAVSQLQLNHISKLGMGFQRENIVLINSEGTDMPGRYQAFRSALLQNSAIVAVASSASSPLRDTEWSMSTFRTEGGGTPRTLPRLHVDVNYFTTYDIPLIAGRLFSADHLMDRPRTQGGVTIGAAIVNERAAMDFGWRENEAIGNRLSVEGMEEYVLVGVVGDTVETARQEVNPLLYTLSGNMGGAIIAIRIQEGRVAEALAHIDEQWQLFVPSKPLERTFLESTVDALYAQETIQQKLSLIFAGVSILIACAGLYGLVAFTTAYRAKEIAIRRVVGSSIVGIVMLMTKDFGRLVLIANIVAWPLAYLISNHWLESFAYRIDVTLLPLIASSVVTLCIAWVTLAGATTGAARRPPVTGLRHE